MFTYFPLHKNDSDQIPMVDTHFFKWLSNHELADFPTTYRAYIDELGYNPQTDVISIDAMQYMITTYTYCLNLRGTRTLDSEHDTIYIVKNRSIKNCSTMSRGYSVDYSGALYGKERGFNYNIDLEMYCFYANAEALESDVIYCVELLNESEFLQRYKAYEAETYLTGAEQISRAHYIDKLEILPPENFKYEYFEHFRMREYTTGSITDQLATLNGVYLIKPIDVTDKGTWITLNDFKGLKPLSETDDNIGFYK